MPMPKMTRRLSISPHGKDKRLLPFAPVFTNRTFVLVHGSTDLFLVSVVPVLLSRSFLTVLLNLCIGALQ